MASWQTCSTRFRNSPTRCRSLYNPISKARPSCRAFSCLQIRSIVRTRCSMKALPLCRIFACVVLIAVLTYTGWHVVTLFADWYETSIVKPRNGNYYRTYNYQNFAIWLTPISITLICLGGTIISRTQRKLLWGTCYLAVTILPVPLLVLIDEIRSGRSILPETILSVAAFLMHLGLCWIFSKAFEITSSHGTSAVPDQNPSI